MAENGGDKKSQSHLPLCRFLWAVGLLGLPFGHYCLVARVDPFYSSIYAFLWFPLIFAVDFVVYRLRGSSLLHDRPREFLLLALWSTPAWLVYEAVNFRLMNWHYVQLPLRLDAGHIYLALSFATVLPGVFELMELVVGLAERATGGRGIRGRPFRVTWKQTYLQMAIGAAMLVLTLVWPETFFCMAWGFAFFLLDPICYLLGGRSLLGQLAKGDNTRFVALLAAGVISGFLWEGWNLTARSKWIYTVPFFDELKLGEMPILGFMGFPPFVLECYAMVNLVSLFRGGRNWELAPEENARLRGMSRPVALWSWIATGTLSLLTFLGIFAWSISSYSIPLEWKFGSPLGEEGRAALKREKVAYSHHFLARWGETPGAPNAPARPEAISPELFERMRRLCRMAELKGMGLTYAQFLEQLGIRTPADLAKYDALNLSRKLTKYTGHKYRVPPARVKVWILEARKNGQ